MIKELNAEKQTSPLIVPLTDTPKASGLPWLTMPKLRHWVFEAQDRYTASGEKIQGNGFDSCLIRIGRRIYVNLDSFNTWLLSHQQSQ